MSMLCWRTTPPNTKKIDVTLGHIFSNRGYFYDMLKEFAIVKGFELEHIKTNSRMVMIDADPRNARSCACLSR